MSAADRTVVVVAAHPVPDSYGAALRSTAVEALAAGGWTVDLIDLYGEAFDPRHSWVTSETGEAMVADHRQRLDAADALVFVHPTWWGAQPAVVKGWLDVVWPEQQRRSGISRLAVVCTHGSTRVRNAVQGVPGRRMIFRALRARCAQRCRTSWLAVYSMDRIGDAERAAFMARVAEQLRSW